MDDAIYNKATEDIASAMASPDAMRGLEGKPLAVFRRLQSLHQESLSAREKEDNLINEYNDRQRELRLQREVATLQRHREEQEPLKEQRRLRIERLEAQKEALMAQAMEDNLQLDVLEGLEDEVSRLISMSSYRAGNNNNNNSPSRRASTLISGNTTSQPPRNSNNPSRSGNGSSSSSSGNNNNSSNRSGNGSTVSSYSSSRNNNNNNNSRSGNATSGSSSSSSRNLSSFGPGNAGGGFSANSPPSDRDDSNNNNNNGDRRPASEVSARRGVFVSDTQSAPQFLLSTQRGGVRTTNNTIHPAARSSLSSRPTTASPTANSTAIDGENHDDNGDREEETSANRRKRTIILELERHVTQRRDNENDANGVGLG